LVEQAAVNRLVRGSSPLGGGRLIGANFRYPPVDTKRRARERPAFCRALCQTRRIQRVCGNVECPALVSDKSRVRSRDTGCLAEKSRLSTVPVDNPPKLSNSLVNTPLQVNRTFWNGGGPWATGSNDLARCGSAARISDRAGRDRRSLPSSGQRPDGAQWHAMDSGRCSIESCLMHASHWFLNSSALIGAPMT
jgi:hypothetical protein